ncbi:MAG TPA: FMN-binding negative transcriptional regulator [Rhodocyclaceae bacterium]
MYLPAHFAETRRDVLHPLMQARPLATLISQIDGRIEANHLPLHLSPDEGPLGVLRGHAARANPFWQGGAGEVLAIFHGPETYITPSWYPSKREHGRVVPTWNYVVVHARCTLRVHDDPDWLRVHLAALTAGQEARFDQPWALADAPADYLARMLQAVVGIELEIGELTGKWKTSQNQGAENRRGVVAGLEAQGDADALAMAALVAAYGQEA